MQLGEFEDRFPAQLSGGQRQRVALARTLTIDPQVLLLDEPFGALDAKVRVELRRSLRNIHDATGLTTIFVTHDQEEALDLADRVAIMNHGVIEQIGAPVEVYESPKTPFIFDFLGHTNSFDCVIRHGKARLGDKELKVEAATCSARPALPPISRTAARSRTPRLWPRTKARAPPSFMIVRAMRSLSTRLSGLRFKGRHPREAGYS